MKTVLITGGTGFLGSALLHKLVLSGDYRLVVLKRSTSKLARVHDLCAEANVKWYDIDKVNLEHVFSENVFDTIIHCATNYGRGKTDVLDVVTANLLLPLKLLQLGIKHGVRTFVNTDTVIDKRVNYYSLSKKQFLEWLQGASDKIQCLNISLEHFYGPFDDESKFTTMIIHKLLRNEPSIALTRGEQKRQFIYIDDVVEAFVTVLNHKESLNRSYAAFEVGTSESVSIRDFVLKARDIVGNSETQLDFGAVAYRENELMESRTDISALRNLGWEPRISLDQGIRKTILREAQQ